jgi:pimeloyl-ACP methyl ester carboxylesterase
MMLSFIHFLSYKQILQSMESKIVNTEHGDIEYSSIGKGRPIVFIHGGHSNCFETLSHKGLDVSKFQLITPSRPGYGKTPLIDNHTPKQAADLIIDLINSLSIDNIIVYGISAGGLTAIEMAANYPDKVEKLILASAISKKWLDENGKVYKTAKKIFKPKTEKITWGVVRFFARRFPKFIADQFYPQFSANKKHKLTKDDVNELITALSIYRSKTGFINDIDQNITEESLGKIKCPTLIIHSKNDNSVSFDHAIHSNNMIHNSKLIELDNEWGHLFWIGSDSNKAIKKIIDFMNE